MVCIFAETAIKITFKNGVFGRAMIPVLEVGDGEPGGVASWPSGGGVF